MLTPDKRNLLIKNVWLASQEQSYYTILVGRKMVNIDWTLLEDSVLTAMKTWSDEDLLGEAKALVATIPRGKSHLPFTVVQSWRELITITGGTR